MDAWRESRLLHYVLLIAVTSALLLPNLGGPSLWDDDEAVNAEAAREMAEARTWIIPTFNFELRTAKPVMLYWLQRTSYAVFGVSEWSARLPSVLAALGTVLLTYELARRMFGRSAGLLAGVVLASAIEFSILAHAATPDAVLLFFTMLTYTVFWFGQENGRRRWWLPTAAACGLAFLTKGPVGVVIPGLVIFAYFAWNRELGRLWDRRIFKAFLVAFAVAAPWYAWVSIETRGQWAKAFFLTENVSRALEAKENHSGSMFFHAGMLLVLFAPWSIFLFGSLWYGIKGARRESSDVEATGLAPEVRAHRFLLCWFASYLLVFSLAATKLPNYVLPLYPALAILTSRLLTRWSEGLLTLPRVLMPLSVAGMVLVGVGLGVGLLLAGGAVTMPKMRVFPGLEQWAVLAIVPILGAIFMAIALRKGDRPAFLRATAISSVLFVALAILPAAEMDRYKAPRNLVAESGAKDASRDLRLASYQWFKPSLVFYAQREVKRYSKAESVVEFLAVPSPGFLFVGEKDWALLQPLVPGPCRIAAKHFDFYSNQMILAVTNDPLPTFTEASPAKSR